MVVIYKQFQQGVNEMNKKNFNLDKIINQPIATQSYPEDVHTDPQEVEYLFDVVKSCAFTENLYDWWTEKGFLTDTQYNKLLEMAGL